jgi:DNA-binding NarL/FixJ family response regulator
VQEDLDPTQSFKVLIVAADPLARAALASALNQTGTHALEVWSTSSANEVDRALERYRPDVVLWDLGLEGQNALESLRASLPHDVPVLTLVAPEASGSSSTATTALSLGASGVLRRDATSKQLAAGLSAVASGLLVIDHEQWPALRPGHSTSPSANPTDPLDALTAREREVLALLGEGLSNRTIAQRLQISEHTAKFHVNAILGKLGVQRRVEAVVRAARLGLIEL